MADISAIKRHLLRRLAQERIAIADIETIADTAAAASMEGKSTVEITATGFEGGNASGTLVVGTNDILRACHDILESVAPIAETPAPRRAFIRADFSQPARFTVPIEQ